jgi:hypothetical protein
MLTIDNKCEQRVLFKVKVCQREHNVSVDLGTDWYKKIFREASEKGSQKFKRRIFWMEGRSYTVAVCPLFFETGPCLCVSFVVVKTWLLIIKSCF